MAVPIEAFSVIVLNRAADRFLTSGIETLAGMTPNSTFVSDGEISRAAFMDAGHAEV